MAALIRRRGWRLAYAPEIVPALVISNNPVYRVERDPAGFDVALEVGRAPVYGFAVAPAGLEFESRIAGRLRGYAGSTAGMVWFTRPVPNAYARAFNYTFDVGGGMVVGWTRRDAIRVG